MTICNINQVEASFLKENNAYENITRMKLFFNEFIKGRQGNLSKDEETYLKEIKDKLYSSQGLSFLDQSRQICRNLFIRVSFRGKQITWNQIERGILGPYKYDTDFGNCCKLIPHMALKNRDDWGTDEKIYFDLKADALNGESNGVDIVLDAEQFNYADHQSKLTYL